MTEPLPAYNTNPRPRPKKWFRPFAAPKEPEGFYSPFWPLLIVFLSFVVLLIYEISFLRYRTVSLNTQMIRLSDGMQKANAQMTFIQGIHTDLEGLAPNHPAAANILKEFFPANATAPAATTDTPETPAPKTP